MMTLTDDTLAMVAATLAAAAVEVDLRHNRVHLDAEGSSPYVMAKYNAMIERLRERAELEADLEQPVSEPRPRVSAATAELFGPTV